MNGEIDMMNQVQVLREEYVEGYVVQMWRRNPSNTPVMRYSQRIMLKRVLSLSISQPTMIHLSVSWML